MRRLAPREPQVRSLTTSLSIQFPSRRRLLMTALLFKFSLRRRLLSTSLSFQFPSRRRLLSLSVQFSSRRRLLTTSLSVQFPSRRRSRATPLSVQFSLASSLSRREKRRSVCPPPRVRASDDRGASKGASIGKEGPLAHVLVRHRSGRKERSLAPSAWRARCLIVTLSTRRPRGGGRRNGIAPRL